MAEREEPEEPGMPDEPDKPPMYNLPAAPGVTVPEQDTTSLQERMLEETMTRQKAKDARIDKLLELYEQSTERETKERTEQKEETAPLYKRAEELASQPLPELPKQQALPPPPDPKRLAQEAQESTATWMSALVPFALVAGGLSKGGAYAASTAMRGVMDGIREGNQDKIEQEYRTWKAATEYAVGQNKQAVEEYNNIFKNKKLNLDQMMNEISLVAAKHQDAVVAEAANRRNLVDMGKIIEAKEKSGADLLYRMEQIELAKSKIDMERLRLQLNKEGILTPGQADQLVDRFANGDNTARQNLGSYAQRGQNMKLFEDAMTRYKERTGKSEAEIADMRRQFQASAAGYRNEFTQESRIGYALSEMKGAIPPAKQAINAYWGETHGTGLGALRWNEVTNWWETEQQSPELGELAVRFNAVLMPYSQALARTGQSTDATRREAHTLLSTQKSPENANRILDTMYNEVGIALKAGPDTRRIISEGITGKAPPPAATPPVAAPATPNAPRGDGWSGAPVQ